MSVAVVTDSTSYLPTELVGGAVVVPLRVSIGDREGVEGVDVTPAQVTKALRNRIQVTTSRPAPAQFVAAYRAALDAGATSVVSVHLAAALSGTWESARLAAEDFPFGTVRVVDSGSTGMALGFAVLAASAAAAAGATASQVQDAAIAAIDRTTSTFYVDNLDYLRRGGRIGAATALLGTSLAVKPLLHMVNGHIALAEKVRTSSKALVRLAQRTIDAAGGGPADVAVQHLDAGPRALELADRLRADMPLLGELYTSEVGAVVGAHLGPGMVATVVVRR